jgi:AcrR family transcriptional regulator
MPAEQMTAEQRSARQRAIAQGPGQQGPGQQGPGKHGPARQRNPRGQGERLRDDIIEAASRLLADPAAPPLTLRAVAREVGVAATSVYLHFADIESLTLAVAERRFGELIRVQDEVREGSSDPCQQVRAGCLAYCEFGLAHQGHYQVMFANPLPMPADMPLEQFPGLASFRRLLDSVARCIGAEPTDEQAFFTAQLIWQQLHGIVSLRISRPRFPWPPLAETVTEAVDRLLAGARRLLVPGRFCLSFLPNGTWHHGPASLTPAPAAAGSSSLACRTAPPAHRPPPRTRTPRSSPSRSRW